MKVCPTCGLRHLIPVTTVRVVSEREARDPKFRCAVRQTLAELKVSASELVQHLLERISRADICYADELGNLVALPLDFLEPSDTNDDSDAAGERALLLDQIETLCTPVAGGQPPRARAQTIRLFCAIATLTRAAYPFEAMRWDVANDHAPEF